MSITASYTTGPFSMLQKLLMELDFVSNGWDKGVEMVYFTIQAKGINGLTLLVFDRYQIYQMPYFGRNIYTWKIKISYYTEFLSTTGELEFNIA